MLIKTLGPRRLDTGGITASFTAGGALNGDVLTAHGLVASVKQEEAGARLNLDIWMENQAGTKIVVGQASCIR